MPQNKQINQYETNKKELKSVIRHHLAPEQIKKIPLVVCISSGTIDFSRGTFHNVKTK